MKFYRKGDAAKGVQCSCPKPRNIHGIWRCVQYRCNHSAFNGYKETPSEYSGVRCIICGARWRTKAAYVESLTRCTPDEAYELFLKSPQSGACKP